MSNIDHKKTVENIIKLFNLDEQMFQLIKEKAQEHQVYVKEFLALLTAVNVEHHKLWCSSPTEETIKELEERIKFLKRISTRFDGYDIKNEPIR